MNGDNAEVNENSKLHEKWKFELITKKVKSYPLYLIVLNFSIIFCGQKWNKELSQFIIFTCNDKQLDYWPFKLQDIKDLQTVVKLTITEHFQEEQNCNSSFQLA